MVIPRREFLQGLLACAAYSVGPRLTSNSASQDMDLVRRRMLLTIGPENAEQARDALASGERLARSLRPDGTWANVDYADQSRSEWKTSSHLVNVMRMAIAYRIAADAQQSSAALEGAIAAALKWWLDHDPHNPNWWHNEIGVPQLLGETLLFLGDAVRAADLDRMIGILKRSDWSRWTGQNLVWGCQNQIYRGLAAHEPDTIAAAYARLYEEVRTGEPTGEGIMPDFSFHQHRAQLYSGGYGLNFANYVGALLFFSWGTAWQIPGANLETYSKYMLYGIAWMTRGRFIDYAVTGREITRRGKAAVPLPRVNSSLTFIGSSYRLDHVASNLSSLNLPRKEEFEAFAARLDGQPNAPELNGNRHFWCSDYLAHRRPRFFTSVRMFSSRLINTEIINSEGKQSHHLADGCNFLYRTGDEYRDIFPVWDWSKVPGTTAEQMNLLPQPGGPHYTTDASFVGGVSDGVYGVAAQQLHRATLSARKAWFVFDEGYAALGAAIRCESGRPVVTAVNQCLLRGDVQAPTGANFVWHDQVAYIFPAQAAFHLTHGDQTGRWSDIGVGSDESVTEKVFNLWLEHGVNPADARYAYLVFPGVPFSEAPALSKDPGIEIPSNTAALQAAWHPKLQLLGVAFWEAGKLPAGEWLSVAVDQPCLVMLQKMTGKMRLSVSNPANQPLRVNVSVGTNLKGESAIGSADRTSIAVDLPAGRIAGSTVIREFEFSS